MSDTSPSPANEWSPGKFLAGLLVGVLMTSGFVKWGWKKPAVLDVPQQLTASVLAATATTDLYDLTQPLEVRLRALEVVAQQRPDEILKVDAEELDHALLNAFYRRRARREAQRLSMQWSAYDTALAKPALRDVLERQYGLSEDEPLKRAMLFKAFRDEPFLSAWVKQTHGEIAATDLLSLLHGIRRHPVATAAQPEDVQ